MAQGPPEGGAAAPFDPRLRRLRRERRLAAPDFPGFLLEEIADRLVDRLSDIRTPFRHILELGAGRGFLARRLGSLPGLRLVVHVDCARAAAQHVPGPFVQAEGDALPFAPGCFDAVLSVWALHWVNDLPGALAQIQEALRPDGLFLAAFPGGDTLFELRRSLTLAELEITGGATARVAPFVALPDAAALLERAGFALPIVDLDRITVRYRAPAQLLDDLRAMGESGAPRLAGGTPLRRDVLLRALDIYRRDFGDACGRVQATFDLVWLTGWKPHPSQPRPKPRGSGTANLARFFGREPGS